MKLIKTFCLSAVLLFTSVTSAHAIGDRERGALIGAGAMLLLPSLIGNANNLFGAPQQRVYQSTTYVEPQRTVVYREPSPTIIYRDAPIQERVIVIDNAPVHRYYEAPRHRPHPHHYPRHHYYDGYYRSYR